MQIKPSNINHITIDKFSEELADKLNFNPGDSLEDLVSNKFKISIEYIPLPEIINSGAIYVKHGEMPLIRINVYDNHLRRRFTLAHELGHYIIHSDMGEKEIIAARNGYNERAEWEANWFAAGFLMPKKDFVTKHNEGLDKFDMSNYFHVSPSAISIREKYLNSIGAFK